MKSKLIISALAILSCVVANAQQITNGDFEGEWVKCYPWEKGSTVTTAYGTQPKGWCISNVPNSAVTVFIGSQVDGYNGGYATQIKNTSALGNGIPGYMTLGTTWATAETKMTSVRNKDGGVFGGISFNYRPDALRLVYKRDNSASTSDVSTVVVYTWKGSTLQADVPSNTAVGVFSWGSATKVDMTNRDNNILGVATNTGGDDITYSSDFKLLSSTTQKITGTASSWTTLNIPLEYKDATVAPEMMNIVIAAAGYQDGGASITDGVSLTVDNVEFVYYHALSALSYDDAINFEEATTSYNLPKVVYNSDNLHYTVKGVAATATTSYNEASNLLTITVKGDDGNSTEYTVQFNKKGDVDGDGDIDLNDVSELVSIILANGNATSNPTADVNRDGDVDMEDVAELIKLLKK